MEGVEGSIPARDHHRSPPGHWAMTLTHTHKNPYLHLQLQVQVGTGMIQVWGGWVGCAWVCRCAQVPKDTAGLVHVREFERVHVYAVKQNSTSTLETGVHIGIHNTIKNNKWGENVNSLNCIPVLSKLICIFANFVYSEGSPDVAVFDKVKETPLAGAQEGTCGLDGESAVYMRKEE